MYEDGLIFILFIWPHGCGCRWPGAISPLAICYYNDAVFMIIDISVLSCHVCNVSFPGALLDCVYGIKSYSSS